MRKRRQGLQVSTFPFLAVLLCTMGSLILMLLVIDRRAKAVARAKAMQAVLKMTEVDQQAHKERQEELERRRRALHADLLRQDQEAFQQIRQVQEKVEAATQALGREQAQLAGLQGTAREASAQLAQKQKEIDGRLAKLSKHAQDDQAAQGEINRLSREMDRLESTLADLQAARKRQQQAYSFIPYKGRQGDNRRPLYVECAANELVFHPDRKTFSSPSPLEIRQELEARLGKRDAPDANAYLLLLVRPDGIGSYYRTLAALQGLKVDYGYEFIERDWVLDFPDKDEAPLSQPWMAAENTAVLPGDRGRVNPVRSRPRPRGLMPGKAMDPSKKEDTQGTGREVDGNGGGSTGSLVGRNSSLMAGTGTAPRSGIPSSVSEGVGMERSPADSPGSRARGIPAGRPPAGTMSSSRGEPASPVIAPSDAGSRTTAAHGIGDGSGQSVPQSAPSGNAHSTRASAGGQETPNESGGGASGSRMASPQGAPAKPAGLRPGMFSKNRDWMIFIECKADSLTLQATGQQFSSAELGRGDHSLVQTLKQMIDNRQARSSRESPYRPMIRFLVRPDGLRSYYLAYPALADLHVPMSRENLDR